MAKTNQTVEELNYRLSKLAKASILRNNTMKVKFEINFCRSESRTAEYRKLLNNLGVHLCAIDDAIKRQVPLEITCSPETFTKFIVRRNDGGFTNGIKELNIEMIEVLKPEPVSRIKVILS